MLMREIDNQPYKYSYAKQYLEEKGVEVYAGKDRILQRNIMGKPNFKYDFNVNTRIKIGDKFIDREDELVIITPKQLYEFGYTIERIKVNDKSRINWGQRYRYRLVKNVIGEKLAKYPLNISVEFCPQKVYIRLTGANAGPLGKGNIVYLIQKDEKVERKLKYNVNDYYRKGSNFLKKYERRIGMFKPKDVFVNIPEVPVLFSENNELVCIEDNDDMPTIGFVGKKGCLSGDVLVELPRNLKKNPNGIKIRDLFNKKDFYVYSFNIKKGKIELKKCRSVWLVEEKARVYIVTLKSGKKIKTTDNHLFLVDICEKDNESKYPIRNLRKKIIGRKYIPLSKLKVGDYLTTWNRCVGELGIRIDYNIKPPKCYFPESRFICSELYGLDKIKNKIVHHKDGNHLNNKINNLSIKGIKEHSSEHTKKRGIFGKEIWKNGEHPRGMLGKKHKEETKKFISINTSLALKGEKYLKKPDEKQYGDKSYCNTKEFKDKVSKTTKEYYKNNKSPRIYNNGEKTYSDRIISIEFYGCENVYDMEVEDNNNFIANGIIVHNCGKTMNMHRVMDSVKQKWNHRMLYSNDSTEHSYTWSRPNSSVKQAMVLKKINEHPLPLPMVYIYPQIKGLPKDKFEEEGIAIRMSLSFKQMMMNYTHFLQGKKEWELGASMKYLDNIKQAIMDADPSSPKDVEEGIDAEMGELIGEETKGLEGTKNKIKACMKDICSYNFLDISSGVPSYFTFKVDGKENIDTLYSGLMDVGVVPSIVTSHLKSAHFFPQYKRIEFDNIRNDQIRKKKGKTWLIADEIGDIIRKKRKETVAAESFRECVTIGRQPELGTMYSLQNYSMLDDDIRNNTNYLFSALFSSNDEVNAIVKDFDLPSRYKTNLKNLKKGEMVVMSNDKRFVVYDSNGNKYKTTGVFRGDAIPTLSEHMRPGVIL